MTKFQQQIFNKLGGAKLLLQARLSAQKVEIDMKCEEFKKEGYAQRFIDDYRELNYKYIIKDYNEKLAKLEESRN